MEYDAVIKNAVIGPIYPGYPDVVRGKIYGDKRKRFQNGEIIITSYIISYDKKSGIVRTKNSTYLVEPVNKPKSTDGIDK